MFNGGGDDVAVRPKYRHIIRFRSAAGENNLLALGPQHSRYGAAGTIQFPAGLLAKLVDTRSVAEHRRHQRSHGPKHFGRYRGGCVVIEVVAGHGFHYNLISTWRIG